MDEPRDWRTSPLLAPLEQAPPEPRSSGRWWVLVTIFTFGLANPFVFGYAAWRMRTRGWWLAFGGYTALWLATFVTTGAPDGSAMDSFSGACAAIGWIGGSIHAVVARPRVFAAPEPTQRQLIDLRRDPAIAAALEADQRRDLSRQILATDPALALDLGIGRPDLGRTYDDGGLVDVNHAPAPVLVDKLGLDAAAADRVVAARTKIGGFSSAEDVSLLADLPPAALEILRDRAVFRTV